MFKSALVINGNWMVMMISREKDGERIAMMSLNKLINGILIPCSLLLKQKRRK
jgi:hypothetical protein